LDTRGGLPPHRARSDDNAFNGRVRWVELDIDDADDDLEHLTAREERLRVAMSRQ
jgi:arylsulfatase